MGPWRASRTVFHLHPTRLAESPLHLAPDEKSVSDSPIKAPAKEDTGLLGSVSSGGEKMRYTRVAF